MQRSGIEAIRTQIQPSKPKREIPNSTISQNIKRTYDQPKVCSYIFHIILSVALIYFLTFIKYQDFYFVSKVSW